ncbi:uncharacterized protein LOC106630757 [Zonotrichia albicollis]|uniref:uncharacterized protein LOC106630757 n=1 Tax=Zonotrichia albicollis TaxID=44394 RepID=UPI003D80EE35
MPPPPAERSPQRRGHGAEGEEAASCGASLVSSSLLSFSLPTRLLLLPLSPSLPLLRPAGGSGEAAEGPERGRGARRGHCACPRARRRSQGGGGGAAGRQRARHGTGTARHGTALRRLRGTARARHGSARHSTALRRLRGTARARPGPAEAAGHGCRRSASLAAHLAAVPRPRGPWPPPAAGSSCGRAGAAAEDAAAAAPIAARGLRGWRMLRWPAWKGGKKEELKHPGLVWLFFFFLVK